jgi:hypothetical protein
MRASLGVSGRERGELGGLTQGSAGRWIALVGACVGGLVLAVLLIPQLAPRTAHGAFPHHHRH